MEITMSEINKAIKEKAREIWKEKKRQHILGWPLKSTEELIRSDVLCFIERISH